MVIYRNGESREREELGWFRNTPFRQVLPRIPQTVLALFCWDGPLTIRTPGIATTLGLLPGPVIWARSRVIPWMRQQISSALRQAPKRGSMIPAPSTLTALPAEHCQFLTQMQAWGVPGYLMIEDGLLGGPRTESCPVGDMRQQISVGDTHVPPTCPWRLTGNRGSILPAPDMII